jgi:hypothetical protein
MQVTVTIPAHLVQPLVGLLDAGLRATGIRSAREAAELVELIDRAVQEAQAKAGASAPGTAPRS